MVCVECKPLEVIEKYSEVTPRMHEMKNKLGINLAGGHFSFFISVVNNMTGLTACGTMNLRFRTKIINNGNLKVI